MPFGTDSRTEAAFRDSDVSSVRNGTAPRRVLKSSAPNRTAGTDPGAVAVSGPAGYVGRCASREKTEFSCFQRIQTHQMTAHEHDNLSLVPRTIRHLSLSPSTCQDLTPDPYFPVLLFRRCRLGRLRSGETVGNGTDNHSVPTPSPYSHVPTPTFHGAQTARGGLRNCGNLPASGMKFDLKLGHLRRRGEGKNAESRARRRDRNQVGEGVAK